MSTGGSNWHWCYGPSKVLWSREARGFASSAGANPAKGKRSGLRILYYWDKEAETVYLLFVYQKSKQADLTPDQAKALGRLIREELK